MSRILLIEDDPVLRHNMVELLTLENYDVDDAQDGEEGVRKAFESNHDLVLCDIMMPKMDGYQVFETLKSHPQTASIPFLFLTAKVDKEDVRRGMLMGADDYILKPSPIQELLQAIEIRLQKRQWQLEQEKKRSEALCSELALRRVCKIFCVSGHLRYYSDHISRSIPWPFPMNFSTSFLSTIKSLKIL
ncbi:response regulator transcription factor [Chrysiogenes arsenatis]|uniref:response regulator transcription factor n=1 Tax=Chrysiogenes arsenatis TaxID=309797 RepID=UPI0004279396|nr:response regulator [Chrysiogenes arsenatis]